MPASGAVWGLVIAGMASASELSHHAATVGRSVVAQAQSDDGETKAEEGKKRRRTRRRRRTKARKARATPARRQATAAVQETTPASDAEKAGASSTVNGAQRRATQDRTKRILEGRSKSRVTPGTASRWSNRGAMVPVVSDVPITQPLPERAVPRPSGVATVGQRLQGREELISARVSIGYHRLQTEGQDIVFELQDPNAITDEQVNPNQSNNLDLIRARTTLSYQRIAQTKLGLQVDAEFRPQLAGRADSRPTDFRLNEAYVSWGRTDWRQRRTGPSWGVALGRVAIREAGYAQADGIAARFRLMPELMIGGWAGVTGNPYGYNWLQQEIEFVSADWYTGGAFLSLLVDRLNVNLAGGATIANVNADAQGVDRIFVFLDASYTVTRGFNLLLNGWLDVLPDGQLFQNIDLLAAYSPTRDLSFSLALGRFSTVVYANTDGATFGTDEEGNLINERTILDANGLPLAPFDAVLLTAVYNSIRVRAGYRFLRGLEGFVRWRTLLRDTTMTNESLNDDVNGAEVQFSSLRSLPTVGLRYRDPKIIDANVGFTYVIDDEATANTIIRGGLGRAWLGFYLGVDARAFFGDIDGYDGGVNLSYTLPRSWAIGTLSLRGSFRYFRENVALFIPLDANDNPVDNPDDSTLLPIQETFYGFAGIDWRY